MTRHLATCDGPGAATKKPQATAEVFHLLVDGGGPFWLYLFARADATLEHLDAFLRQIWLECCGHLSAFQVGGRTYSFAPDGDFGDKSMSATLRKVLSPKLKFTHEYDFGSTTELLLTVVGTRDLHIGKDKVLLAARNEKPIFPCHECKNPAEFICTECMYDRDPWLCKKCSKKHTCDEEMLLPFVNSPWTGVCAYTG